MRMMVCKNCGHRVPEDELIQRYQAGIGTCSNPKCNPIDWVSTKKYGKLILLPTEYVPEDSKDLND